MVQEKKVRPGTGAFIIDPKGRMLLVRSPFWKNQYMIPGGHIEYGESIFETVKREVKEEVGLDVKPLGVIVIAEDIFPKSHKLRGMHYIYFDVICKTKSAKVKIDNYEITDYMWADPKKAIKLVKHPTLKRGLKEYLKQKSKGKVQYIDIS